MKAMKAMKVMKAMNLCNSTNKLLLTVVVYLCALYTGSSDLFAQSPVTLPTGTSTWTVPAGVDKVTVQVWGAGGGGAGGDSGNEDGGGGGGGGGYSTSVDIAVTAGDVIPYTVGAGGNGGNDQQDGFDGAASTILGVTANGGSGGNCDDDAGNRNGGNGGAGTTSNGGDGGNGVNNNGAGGGGEGGCTTGDGEDGNAGNGAGTDGEGGNNCDGGDGGQGNQSNDGPGSPGSGPGGGGGGGTDDDGDGDGGNGADGRIVITYTVTAAECNPCYSVASGDFDDPATWSDVSGGAAGFTPEDDGTVDIFIEGTDVVNMNTSWSVNDITIGSADVGTLNWTAASVTLTIEGGGTLTVGNGSALNENTQTDAAIVFNAGSATYGLVVNDVTPGLVIDNLVFAGPGTLNISGTGTITVNEDLVITGNTTTTNNNLTGAFTVGGNGYVATSYTTGGGGGGTVTIWSEDFETGYSDNDETAQSNNEGAGDNKGAAGADWTFPQKSSGNNDEELRVENSNPISGTYSLRGRECQDFRGSGINDNDIWETEDIDITGLTNVTIDLDWKIIGEIENDDYLYIDYRIDAGAWTNFETQSNVGANDASVTTGSSNVAGLTGTTLELRVRMGMNQGSEYMFIDNVVITATEAAGSTITAGGSHTFNDNQDISFTGDLIFAGDNNTYNLNGTTAITGNLYLAGLPSSGTTTIWSEDFETNYGDDDNAAQDNNTGADPNKGAAGADWTHTVGGADWFRVEQDDQINGTYSMQCRDTDEELTWTTEAIDITGLSNVIITMNYRDHDTGDNDFENDGTEYITAQYQLNGAGAYVDFGTHSGEQNVLSVFTSPALSGATSLKVRVLVFTGHNDERYVFDDVVVNASSGSLGDNNTYNNWGTLNITEDLVFNNNTNILNNNGTLTVGDDVLFGEGAYTCELVTTNGSTNTINDRIDFVNETSSHNNRLTNDGTLTAVDLWMDQSDILITNSANGTFTLTDDMFSDDADWQVINAGTMTLVDFETDDTDDNNFTITNSGELNFRNYDGGNAQTQIIDNTGTINQSGTFQNIAAAQTTFTNGINGRWNYAGTGHDTDVRLYCSSVNNTFNYNRNGSNQQIITVQNNDYHHLEITNSNTKTPLSTYIIDIEGNLTISGTADFDVDAQNNDITIAGNWINTSLGQFIQGTEDVTFDGVGDQGVTCTLIGEEYYNLFVNKNGGGSVVLNSPVFAENRIEFQGANGYIALNGSDLTKKFWNNGDIVGYSTVNFIIVDQVGFVKFTGVDDTEVLNIPMGLADGVTNYTVADLTMVDAGDGNFAANLCPTISKAGGTCSGAAETDSVVTYTWNFVSTSDSAGVKLTWDDSKELTTFDRTLSSVCHFDGTSWKNLTAYGAAVSEGGSLWSRSGPTSGFSPYGVQTDGDPLPIELLSFTVLKKNDVVLVEWVTGVEINNDFFTLERSTDGIHFYPIATIIGAGNSFEEKSYSYEDRDVVEGDSYYYRLAQTDFEGVESKFGVVQVNFIGESENLTSGSLDVVVYPNPAKNGQKVFLKIDNSQEEKEVLLVMYDALGSQVYSKFIIVSAVSETLVAIETRGRVASGIYYITGSSENRLFNKRILIR